MQEGGWNTGQCCLGLIHAVIQFVTTCSNPGTDENIKGASEVLYYIVMLSGFHEASWVGVTPLVPNTPSKENILGYSKEIAFLVIKRRLSRHDMENFYERTPAYLNDLMRALMGYSGKDLVSLATIKYNDIA